MLPSVAEAGTRLLEQPEGQGREGGLVRGHGEVLQQIQGSVRRTVLVARGVRRDVKSRDESFIATRVELQSETSRKNIYDF